MQRTVKAETQISRCSAQLSFLARKIPPINLCLTRFPSVRDPAAGREEIDLSVFLNLFLSSKHFLSPGNFPT